MNPTIAAIIAERQAAADRKRAWIAAEPRSERAIERNERTIAAIEADIAATKKLVAGWDDARQSRAAEIFTKHGIDDYGRRTAAGMINLEF